MKMRLLIPVVLLIGCQTQTSVIKQKKKLTVSPELIDFGVLAVGDTATATIDLTHVDGPEVQVVTLSMLNIAGSWFSTDQSYHPTIAVNGQDALTVTYNPGDAGYHRARLTITTDEEDEADHVVELRGSAAFPSADLYPPLVDFGEVSSGTTALATVTLTNTGSVPLDLASLDFSDSRFGSTQGKSTLSAGEMLEISLTYDAKDEDPATATLSLDLGSAPARSVDLQANNCEHGDADLYDQDQDGYTVCGGDCDDHDKSAYPSAQESCDTIDNNCDGTVDETTDCYDDDGDGVTELDGDCNDADPKVHPGGRENYSNGLDDDCDGVADYGDQDLDGDGYSTAAGDCDDADPSAYPGATEKADSIDNDCDGVVDDGTNAFDDDGDGYSENAGDCNDSNAAIYPSAKERADGLDNDCDGQVDEGTSASDDDGDGFTENGGDCDDGNSAISPAASEVVGDGIDNDCDGIAR